MVFRGMNIIKTDTMADNEKEQWHWQEQGTAWKGVGIYHVTMVVSSREDLLGTLVIPNDDPEQAHIVLSLFGEEIKNCVKTIPDYHPEIQILALRMMPDHVHFILHVRRKMQIGIKLLCADSGKLPRLLVVPIHRQLPRMAFGIISEI